jgi:hypothetical protein
MPARRVGRLDTLGGIVTELGRVYRDCRNGRTSSGDGAKLAYMLGTLRATIETADLEGRLATLEAELHEGKSNAD